MSLRFANSSKILQNLANVVVVAGVPLFFYQLHVNSQVRAAERSFQLVQAYQSGDGGQARQRAIAPFWDYPEIFQTKEMPQSSYIDFVKQLADANKELTLDISVVDFWMKLAFECEQSGSCSAQVNSEMFEPLVTDLYCLYSPLFVEWQEELSIADFGQHIAHYSKTDSCNLVDS